MNRVSPLVVIVLGTSTWLAPMPAARAEDRPRVWAVVVGIDRYKDALIPRCVGSVRDARAITEWFSTTAGWGDKNVLRMDDLGTERHGLPAAEIPDLLPTRANLDWAVTDWLRHRVRKGDVVVIYFAGQATARPPRSGEPAGRAYLLPIDAAAADVPRTGWSLDEALDRSGLARLAKVVVWLDTSTRGRGDRGLALEPGAPSGQDWLRALTRWSGVTAWLAADGRPAPESGSPGPFVAAMIRAMGTEEKAHTLLGALKGLRDDRELIARGFQTLGGVGPAVSLWSAGVKPVEEAVPELIVQAGHGDRVTAVLVTPDNTRMITASQDSTVRVWGLADRSLVRVLTDPIGGVEALALDRDGGRLMAGDGLGRIVGWDMTLDRPKPLYGPTVHTEGITSLHFLNNGKGFVSLDRSGRSILWDAGGIAIRKVRDFFDARLIRIVAAVRPAPRCAAMVAAVEGEVGKPSTLQTFDASGRPVDRFDGPGGRISALDLSADGRRLAIGDDAGRVVVRDLPGRSVVFDRTFEGRIHRLRLSNSGSLLISDTRTLRLVRPGTGGFEAVLVDSAKEAIVGEVDRAEFSDDGRWLAACTPIEGRLHAWDLIVPGSPWPVTIPDDKIPGLSPAFGPDGRTLLLGDADGGLRAWAILDAQGGPRAEPRPRILPARGKVAELCPSPSGRFLLEITRDDIALIWDLEQGRGARPLPETWVSGAFLKDESKLVMATHPDRGGDVVVFDRDLGRVLPIRFDRPIEADGRPSKAVFARVVTEKSGQWVAAASLEGQLPLACVWDASTGKLAHTIRDHNSGLTAIDFSGDGAYLLTASEDGAAKLWLLGGGVVEPHRATMTFFNPAPDSPAITAARVCPTSSGRVVTGTRAGRVFLWDWEKDRRTRSEIGQLEGEINAVAFSADGRWLSASGAREKTVRFWSLADKKEPAPVVFQPQPHHAEQVGALASWPNGTMFVSGGDDTAVKFWDIKSQALIGTLVAQVRNPVAVDWLAFTPDGQFDGSMPGQEMVKWRVGEKIVTLDQSEDTHHSFQLAAAFARGERPPAKAPRVETPELKIVDPPTSRSFEEREVELTLWSGDRDLTGFRLYQNGIPIRGEVDFRPGPVPNTRTTKVKLVKGENRIYAMASHPATADGRSQELALRYDGAEPPGRLHTLALGISGYKKRALKYAHLDAQRIAEFLQAQGVQGGNGPGERIILIDDQVNEDNIQTAFLKLQNAVKGRPEDTVVLFLAGHTDTDEVSDQFCLLLPDFPFVDNPPLAQVAIRGNPGVGVRVNDPNVLAYVTLYNRLAHLEALQRLVIVDACQAGAIIDDPAVRKVQRLLDKGSRKARNSYLLAARRGEPANEADALRHGLLTYTLLKGMGARGLATIPEALGGFPGPPTADFDHDGFVSTDELVSYADGTLPRLARIFPQLVLRTGGGGLVRPANQPSPDLERKLKVQAAESAFRLIAVPAGP